MSSKLQLDVVTTVRGGAIWWTQTKAKGRHGVVCRLNCVIHVWAPWGRDTCHLRRYINPRTFTFTFHLATCEMWCWSGGRGILTKLSLCYSIVYYYNGGQRYEQFLQVGRLYRALILLGLALYHPREEAGSCRSITRALPYLRSS